MINNNIILIITLLILFLISKYQKTMLISSPSINRVGKNIRSDPKTATCYAKNGNDCNNLSEQSLY